MAEIVFAFGSSHGPTIATRPENWDRIVERDKQNPRYDYNELLRNAKASIKDEMEPCEEAAALGRMPGGHEEGRRHARRGEAGRGRGHQQSARHFAG